MGYDLHITRRKSWADEGDDIGAAEWLAYVRADQEFTLGSPNGPYFAVWRGEVDHSEAWLDWSDGQIYSKHPPPALVDRMVTIARHFNGTVQGDDGEIYEGGAAQAREPHRSVWERLAAFWRRVIPASPLDIDHSAFPLHQGDHVSDSWGQRGVIVAVDPRAEHGMGAVRVRYDDGREMQYSMLGHPFRKIDAE